MMRFYFLSDQLNLLSWLVYWFHVIVYSVYSDNASYINASSFFSFCLFLLEDIYTHHCFYNFLPYISDFRRSLWSSLTWLLHHCLERRMLGFIRCEFHVVSWLTYILLFLFLIVIRVVKLKSCPRSSIAYPLAIIYVYIPRARVWRFIILL